MNFPKIVKRDYLNEEIPYYAEKLVELIVQDDFTKIIQKKFPKSHEAIREKIKTATLQILEFQGHNLPRNYVLTSRLYEGLKKFTDEMIQELGLGKKFKQFELIYY